MRQRPPLLLYRRSSPGLATRLTRGRNPQDPLPLFNRGSGLLTVRVGA